MDLNEMKEKAKDVKAPEITFGGLQTTVRSVDDLIDLLKIEDARIGKTLRRMVIFFVITGIIYAGIFVLTFLYPPDSSVVSSRLALGLAAFVMLSTGFSSRAKLQQLARVDYAKPVLSFLEDAEKRYRFLSPKDLRFVIPYFIVWAVTGGISWMNGFDRYLHDVNSSSAFVAYCVFLVIALSLGFRFGMVDWRKKKKPLWDQVKRMKAEMSADATEIARGNGRQSANHAEERM